ncbi:GyrI-like domain-containing protein [Leifsonia sp. YAF41]|uniref:GyrI-like domain-containing protein n=1 Tax=Leifsonia sp. YAF41 TaxID=3233086 RepID=UPI003F9432DE
MPATTEDIGIMDIEQVQLEPRMIAGVCETVPMDRLTEFFGRAFGTTATELARQGVFPTGPPVAHYYGAPTATVKVTAGFPVGGPVTAGGGMVTETLPGGPAIQTIHVGSYEGLAATYSALIDWFAERGLTAGSEMWEEYLVGPDGETDTSQWKTRVVYPL